jgi:hypothetical protein
MLTYTAEGGPPLDITEETAARIHALHTLTGVPVADLCSTATELLRQQLLPSTKPTAIKAVRPKKAS